MILMALAMATLAAYLVKGMSGFGSALLLVPVVAVLVGPAFALSLSAGLDLVAGAVMVAALRWKGDELRFAIKMAALVGLFSAVGGAIAGFLPVVWLMRLIGLMVAVIAVWLLVGAAAGNAEPTRWRKGFLWLGCMGGGLVAGATGTGGPLVVAAAKPMLPKEPFRRIMSIVWLVNAAVRIAAYGATGLWDPDVHRMLLLLAPVLLAGLWIGQRVHLRLSEAGFNTALGAILLILAVRVLLG